MHKYVLRGMTSAVLVAASVLAGVSHAADDFAYAAAEDLLPDVKQSVKILPSDVSRQLKIQRIPTSEPVPLLIGTYWSCHYEHDFEICRFKLVVCTNDQTFCTEV